MLGLLNEMEAALKEKRPDLYRELIRNGVFTSKVLLHREVFLYFHKEKILGNKTVKAIRNTADRFNVCEDTVYKAIRNMK